MTRIFEFSFKTKIAKLVKKYTVKTLIFSAPLVSMEYLLDVPHIQARFQAVRQFEWPGAGNFRITNEASKVRYFLL